MFCEWNIGRCLVALCHMRVPATLDSIISGTTRYSFCSTCEFIVTISLISLNLFSIWDRRCSVIVVGRSPRYSALLSCSWFDVKSCGIIPEHQDCMHVVSVVLLSHWGTINLRLLFLPSDLLPTSLVCAYIGFMIPYVSVLVCGANVSLMWCCLMFNSIAIGYVSHIM